jgi:hypothetical protein
MSKKALAVLRAACVLTTNSCYTLFLVSLPLQPPDPAVPVTTVPEAHQPT